MNRKLTASFRLASFSSPGRIPSFRRMAESHFDHFREFKIILSFNPIGSAPRLKVNKFSVDGKLKFRELLTNLNKLIDLENNSKIHLYINNSIEPSEDHSIGDYCNLIGKSSSPESFSMNIYYSIGRAYL